MTIRQTGVFKCNHHCLLFCKCKSTRHVFVKHGCPRRQQSQKWQKSLSPTFWPYPHPQGHVMSVKCEESIYELTVQVWLLYHHPNFKYCTLLVSGTELRTDRRTDKRTDRRTIRLLDAPGGLSGRGHKNCLRRWLNIRSYLVAKSCMCYL